ncbi:MAG TPA: hypothetical protein VLF63_01305, partial [Patescibacteria group bacterium]|nr:hypothetical protein [Patescibacteria group bacterium]
QAPIQASPTTGDVTNQTNQDIVSTQSTDTSNSDLTNGNVLNVLTGVDSTVISNDNLVTVDFPKGTFSADAYCSVDTAAGSPLPFKTNGVIGPYSIDCTDSSTNPINTFKKAVSITMSTQAHKKYIAYMEDNKWVKLPTSSKSKSISFKLAKDVTFEAASKKSSNWLVIFMDIGVIIAFFLIVGGIVYMIRRRQYLDTTPYST